MRANTTKHFGIYIKLNFTESLRKIPTDNLTLSIIRDKHENKLPLGNYYISCTVKNMKYPLSHVTFEKCIIKGKLNVSSAVFIDCVLNNVICMSMQTYVTESRLSNVVFTGPTKVVNSTFNDVSAWTHMCMEKCNVYKPVTAMCLEYYACEIHIDIQPDAVYTKCEFKDREVSCINATLGNFLNCEIIRSTLSECNVVSCNIRSSILHKSTIKGRINFEDSTIISCHVEEAELNGKCNLNHESIFRHDTIINKGDIVRYYHPNKLIYDHEPYTLSIFCTVTALMFSYMFCLMES